MATIPALTPVGNRYLLLVADPLNAEQESDETNNVVSFAVTIAGGSNPSLPDLELWRPSLSFAAVPAGGSTGAFTFIFNRGPGVAGPYEIGYYLSADTVFSASTDVFLGLVTGSLTTPGGTIHFAPVLTVPATTVPGNYYLVLMADPRNVITETNENNNSRALPLRVTGLATAVAQPAAATLALYPNPAPRGSALRIVMADCSSPRLEAACYDAMGRFVGRQWVGDVGRNLAFDTSQLPAGVYMLRLTGSGLHLTHRIQIE
ncbi:CARDB domain-containing protein [Hymenobacter sp. UYCo722]|uniref:CARDB domain-containing protein n=1 Tax=Hymenobacter sp. UYCo722 TaxID=3156335 RepID=UPI00339A65E5